MARAVVVAAGQSRRMGGGVNKQLLSLAGRPVLACSLAAFEECADIEEYVLVVGAPDVAKFSRLVREQWGCRKMAAVVAGGATRQDSVWAGLLALPGDTQVVVVHDGARPFLTGELIQQVVAEAIRWGAATLAVPVRDTVKKVAHDFVVATVPRESLWLTQTPQAFSFPLLLEAHRRARTAPAQAPAPDDAFLVEALGCRVKIVTGSPTNIKITTPGDMVLAQAIARAASRGG